MNARHTITLNDEAYLKMKSMGKFGESYSELVTRLADLADISTQSTQRQESENDSG
jgi:predicted CopG family antitoxin